MKYKIVRSSRKTLGLEVREEEIIIRAPERASIKEIDNFVRSHRDWIEKKLKKLEEQRKQAQEPLTDEELNALVSAAKEYIPGRVAHYAPIVGVRYGRVTIRKQHTRWGSCSAKRNLSFNCLLMLTPPEVIDSVVVHELCHLKEMNHSRRFYHEVIKAYPEYRKWDKWLRENGRAIMMRNK
ncbi:MAG: M48 family metallopeptidase [Firmicutes bacterium]|nr:M48 family metallopeptidase [Bacillota bacterium]